MDILPLMKQQYEEIERLCTDRQPAPSKTFEERLAQLFYFDNEVFFAELPEDNALKRLRETAHDKQKRLIAKLRAAGSDKTAIYQDALAYCDFHRDKVLPLVRRSFSHDDLVDFAELFAEMPPAELI